MICKQCVKIECRIECARKNTNVNGLFSNNNIELQNYLEKKEQPFRKVTAEDVTNTFGSDSWKDNKMKG